MNINLTEYYKACQHDDHWRFCIAGAAERTGVNLIYSAKEIEGCHKSKEHCSVRHGAFYIDEEGYKRWRIDHYGDRENHRCDQGNSESSV